MAANFRRTVHLGILTLGAFVFLQLCPTATAQQSDQGAPQTAPATQSSQGAPVTAPAPQDPAKASQPAKAPPKKTPRFAAKKSTKKPAAAPAADASAEPDKVLYDRAQADLKAGRYTEGRLALQTLINTYPDSEFLAKAKLAVADSYYKEGGTSSTTQSISEYKDFITFFPFLEEAAYAQMQVAMAHYRMMEKADRDSTQAQAAEDEFQAFILKYPQSPLVPKAEQYLREVQEVLGDGEFRIARYYYLKTDYRAAAARLVEVTDRYPLYSQTDEALWMLGSVYSRAKLASKNEDDKNHWGDLAAKCYDRILQDYPLSNRAVDARARLSSMGLPIPPPDPQALQRMKNDQLWAQQHHQSVLVKAPMAMIKGSPDVSTATRQGTPQMNPPTDAISATDVLKPGASGPSFTMTATNAGAPSTDQSTEAPVDATTQPTGAPAPGTGVGFQIISAPNDPNAAATPPPAAADPAPPANDTTLKPSSNVPVLAPTSGSPASSEGSGTGTAPPPATESTPTSSSAARPVDSSSAAPQGGTTGTASQTPAAGAPAAAPAAPKAAAADPTQESTSKKKKGIKKLIPW
ncbi:MAG TPA: outer membrane protein assembly factor BamD [Candidatus Acidoferrales bacterium]|nr:outer membrane protein assembly factor BamD [Candidatus Acidoferrales bacterium]